MMRRLSWVLFAALALGATAAAAADKTVGVILSGNITYYQEIQKAFAVTLVKEGFDHSKVDTLLQMPSPDPLSWTNAARKLVVADVNVLVTYGAPSTLAAIRETKSIPIVFAGVCNPAAIGSGGQNIAGISSKVPLTSLLRYLRKLMPFTRSPWSVSRSRFGPPELRN
jgi:putative ABC transport system substrate-binding protein